MKVISCNQWILLYKSDDSAENIHLKYISALSDIGNYMKLCGMLIFSIIEMCHI